MVLLAQDLRDAILQAAVQGKLSDRRITDTPVSKTFVCIKEDKDSALVRKGMKDRKVFPPITNKEATFELPENWAWVRINDIGVFKKGPFGSALTKSMFIPKGENSIKVYEQKNAIRKDWTLGEYFIEKQYYEKSMKGFTVEPKDIIVSCAGTIGETYIMPEGIEIGIINQALMRMTISDHINHEFFLLVFDHLLKEKAQKNSAGSAIKNIPPFDVFKAMLFPLPPIEEQFRIVARVKELMERIDEYEKLETELAELKQRFPGEMKEAFLQAAMQGKVSEHLENDEDIDLYYTRVMEEQRICSKKDKTEEDDGNYPFDIPDHWKWIRLNHLVAKEIRRGKSPKYATLGSALSFAQKCNSKHTGIRLDLAQFLDEDSLARYTEVDNMVDNDIVVNSTGGGTLGRVGLYKDIYNPESRKVYPDSHVTVVRAKKRVCPEYLYYCLKYYSPYLETLGEGSTNQTELKPATLKNLYIPIPPIEEQQRIVDKLDSLLPICDELAELA